jgi:hypothetical protein
MPEFIITIVKRTAIGEVIKVNDSTIDSACQRAIEYGLGKQEAILTEILPWSCGVESISDHEDREHKIPVQFLDPALKIEALENMLRAVIESARHGPAPDVIVKDALSLLS